MNKGKVYFVGTPIGNLADITLRALDTLKNVDLIACEDTRHSSILLQHYDIKKPTFSYHKFNEKTATQKIISYVQEGKNIAVISDAGMPVISDPGFILLDELIKNDIEYEIIPGPSAVVTALVGSGLDTQNFVFGGFLPDKKIERETLLQKLSLAESTIILYSADHDLEKDLDTCFAVLGNRRVVVANDLTKKFERFYRGVLGELEIENIKGEFVILIEGLPVHNDLNDLSILEHYNYYLNSGIDKKEAIKKVAKDRQVSKSTIYNEILKINENN